MDILITGDHGVGKTTFLNQFTTATFSEKFFPNVFDFYSGRDITKEENNAIRMWDIYGGQTPEASWTAKYNCADVIIICFAIDNIDSFKNVKNTWYPEVQLHAPGSPVVLVGTKSDLRETSYPFCSNVENSSVVTTQMGQRLATEIRAHSYFECSAKCDRESVANVLEYCCICLDGLTKAPEVTAKQSFPAEIPALRSWMGSRYDPELCYEALRFNAPVSALATKLQAAQYLDIFRALGHNIYAMSGWGVEGGLDDMRIYVEAYHMGAPPLQLTSRALALQFLDTQRAAGTEVKSPPSWVVDAASAELFERARLNLAPPRTLVSRTDTQLFLLKINDNEAAAGNPAVSWWAALIGQWWYT